MHLLAYKIKNAWRKGKVASVLFLDIEGAFPNAVTDRLLHNMRNRKIPEQYIIFVGNMLRERKTRLRFDDYTSEPYTLTNGIGQGDPLSMLLYLFYNADLLDISRYAHEAALGYVDDTILYAEGDNFNNTNASLTDMMTREGGCIEWAQDHNSKFETSKFALIGFTRRRQQIPGGRTTAQQTRQALQLNNVTIEPSSSHKFLGVIFDQELR
jgi:hypothetical protein